MTQHDAATAKPDIFAWLRRELVGLDVQVPTLDGRRRSYVSLDNAASTPTFNPVMEKVDEFLRYYANVHRGTGFKSQIASWVYDEARKVVARFVHAGADSTVIFTKNTTESINKLARLYPFKDDAVVLTTMMEHHSNDLPWRRSARTVHVGLNRDGSLDIDDYERKLEEYRGRVAMVAVTGASNVSGWVNPVHLLARRAHEAGARIMVDAAQLAPHRPIDMKPVGDPEHIDFLAFSAHKMYAPYGVGALVGERQALLNIAPDIVGGGAVDIVTVENAYWRDLPEREEAGTPDIVGVVALASAIRLLETIGWSAITAHEERLTRYMLGRLAEIPGIVIYGKSDGYDVGDRLGVVAFNVGNLHHALVSAVLSYEGGIGVRSGCFCAHPYMLCLLGVGEDAAQQVRNEILARDRTNVPGAVRASVGIYNDESDVDALCECLKTIQGGHYRGRYEMCKETGNYVPVGSDCFDFEHHFTLDPRTPGGAGSAESVFVTAINCMDGRTQEPVNRWMKRQHRADFVDEITEPGPVKLLAEAEDHAALQSLRRRAEISVGKHGSKHLAIVAHHGCAGNPVDRVTQVEQLKSAAVVVESWGLGVSIELLWVGQDWEVEQVC